MKIAVVGATGMVGNVMLKVLEERNLPINKLLLVASERSVGTELIYQNKKILICQRKEEGDHPLKWEFPGGKVKELEDNQEALSRELKEELNIEINEMIFFDEYLYEYKELSKKLKLVFFNICINYTS